MNWKLYSDVAGEDSLVVSFMKIVWPSSEMFVQQKYSRDLFLLRLTGERRLVANLVVLLESEELKFRTRYSLLDLQGVVAWRSSLKQSLFLANRRTCEDIVVLMSFSHEGTLDFRGD